MSPIGLESGLVRLTVVQAEAAKRFARVREHMVTRTPPSWRIEHIGSTAVPYLLAKPILDIAVGVPVISDVPAGIAALEALGYRYRGDRADAGGHVFDLREGALTMEHVHLTAVGSRQWDEYLLFRDYLIRSAQARTQYEAAKRELAAQFPDDRRQYTAGKVEIVRALVARCRNELRESPASVAQNG